MTQKRNENQNITKQSINGYFMAQIAKKEKNKAEYSWLKSLTTYTTINLESLNTFPFKKTS